MFGVLLGALGTVVVLTALAFLVLLISDAYYDRQAAKAELRYYEELTKANEQLYEQQRKFLNGQKRDKWPPAS
jgi:hypothetical protein